MNTSCDNLNTILQSSDNKTFALSM